MTKSVAYRAEVINESGYVVMYPNLGDLADMKATYPPNPYAESKVQLFPLGTKLIQGERVWRYTKNGGTGLAIAAPVQAAAAIHAELPSDIVVGADSAIGAYTVTLTSTANLATAPLSTKDGFAEGYLIINDLAGEGQLYKIKGHEAASGTSNFVVTLYDPLTIALTTSSQAGLAQSPYANVVVTPGTTPTGMVLGIPAIAVTASYYFWLQTGGPAAGVAQAAIPVGAWVSAGIQGGKLISTTAEATYGITRTTQVVGFALTPAVADTESFMVFLTLDR